MQEKVIIVHGLKNGYAVCGFSDKVPKDWPEGHVWVEHWRRDKITCEVCRVLLGEEMPPPGS